MNIQELYEMECLKNEEDIQNGIIYNVAILIKGEHVSRFKFEKIKGKSEKQLKDAVLKNGAEAYIVLHHGKAELGNSKTGVKIKCVVCARTLYTPELKLMNTIAYEGTKIVAKDNWDGREAAYDPYDAWVSCEPVELIKTYKRKWDNGPTSQI